MQRRPPQTAKVRPIKLDQTTKTLERMDWNGKRESNPRPSAWEKVAGPVTEVTSGSQAVADPRLQPAASIQRVSSKAAFSKDFASPLLPDFSSSLTVKEVAARLHVCTATVYRLCAADDLRHFRVGAAIRIREEDLAAYRTR
jgi:excisionase family DNA binding protein